MGKLARRIILLLVLVCLLATTVHAQTSATSVSTLVTVAPNGQAAVTMNVSIHLANPSPALSFPLPKGADKVTLNGTTVELTPKEYDMLSFLTSNAGIALSREQILNSVWSFDYFGDLRTVDTHVKQLRSKLGDYGDLICTVRGIGYRFENVEGDAEQAAPERN